MFCIECGSRSSATEVDAAIGSVVLGRYRINQVIGEGAMGRVYEAEQQMGTASRRVAIKALHETMGRDRALAERFRRECEVVIQLEHPNTIRFYDFGNLPDGRMAIVMEYVDGETLGERLRRGPLPGAQVDRIVHQVCGSLHEAHQRGIVHRDLKPDNVMLTVRAGEQDVVKVCDFGIAMVEVDDEARLTQQGAILGTPQYMSPEQFKGAGLDPRSDVYSLGVMVYEMLTGALPFEAENVFMWAQCHLQGEPRPLESHPAGVAVPLARRRAVMRALSKRPEDRPASVLDFARELTGALETPSAWGGASGGGRVAATAYMPISAPGHVGSAPGVTSVPPGPVPPGPGSTVGYGQAPPGPGLAPSGSGSKVGFGQTQPLAPSGPGSMVGYGQPQPIPAWSGQPAGPKSRATLWVALAMFAIGALGVGGVGAYFALRHDHVSAEDHSGEGDQAHGHLPAIEPVEVDLDDAGATELALIEPPAQPDPPPPPPAPVIEPPPAGWMRVVHFQEGVSEPSNAIGPADGRYAVIEPGGRITIELAAGTVVAGDRGPGPDLFVAIDDTRSGPYQLAVGTGHQGLRVIAHDLVGSVPLDIDQYRVRQARYVRISARSDRPVYLDSVGYYHQRAATSHRH